jgi:hypothetical protein
MLALTACAVAPEAGDVPMTRDSLRALRWFAPGADRVAVLTTQPAPCEAKSPDVSVEINRALGQIAFESPALLGGAAARIGLSCSSCHLNGRGNSSFLVEGVSGAPGTADVTSSLFSKVRGNGAFDPVPIPDLALRDGRQIKDRSSPEFRAKVHGLVVEEFDGTEPPAAVFEDLLAYLDSLGPANCAASSPMAAELTWRDDYGAAGLAAEEGETNSSPEVALFYLRAARERLERLNERYAAAELAPVRSELLKMSRMLAAQADAVRTGLRPPPILGSFWTVLGVKLKDGEARSLYNPDVLRAALAQ